MLIPSQQLITKRPISLHTGRPLNPVSQPIVDPYKLKIVGFYLQNDSRLLMVNDIREISADKIAVDSEDVLVEAQDLHRHKEILDMDYQLIDTKTATKSGDKLGKIDEYIIDDISWEITKIHIRQPMWRNLANGILIVDRQQIVEVKIDLAIVEDAIIGSTQLAAQQVSS